MKKYLFLLLLACFTYVAYGNTDGIDSAWGNLMDAVNTIIPLNVDIDILSSQIPTLTDQLTALQDAAADAAAQAETIKKQQELLSLESNVMLRGKLNTVINNTATPFSIALPDGTRIAVAAQSQVALNSLFSAYSEGGLVGGIISIIPQVAGATSDQLQDISGESEAQAVGLSYSLSFNLQGLNQSGYAYGALNTLSVTRTYPSASTRAHSLDLNSLIKENEIWAVDLTLNYVPGMGDDDTTFIYPRWSTLYTNPYSESNTSTIPDVIGQTAWATSTIINESNSYGDLCYPSFTNEKTAEMWADLISQAG